MTELDALYQECEQEAIAAGALKPQGFLESMGAGFMTYNYEDFSNTAVARERLHQWTIEIMRRKGYLN